MINSLLVFFRKETFTGLGLNVFSFCPKIFKLNSCKTLLYRAYCLCSNWIKFHEEVAFLKQYFRSNCFPLFVFDKIVRNFLADVFQPKFKVPTVPKKASVCIFAFYYGLHDAEEGADQYFNEILSIC